MSKCSISKLFILLRRQYFRCCQFGLSAAVNLVYFRCWPFGILTKGVCSVVTILITVTLLLIDFSLGQEPTTAPKPTTPRKSTVYVVKIPVFDINVHGLIFPSCLPFFTATKSVAAYQYVVSEICFKEN